MDDLGFCRSDCSRSESWGAGTTGSIPRMGNPSLACKFVRGTAFAPRHSDVVCPIIDAGMNLDAVGVDPDLKRTDTGNGAELCK